MYNYLTIKLGSSVDAEDVLQEVFCRLMKYQVRLKVVRNPSAYIFKIARNEAISFLKKRKKLKTSDLSTQELSAVIQQNLNGPDPESLKLAADVLALLPTEQREVIILRFFEGLTFREVSDVCGISMGTVTSRYRYGMEKLRTILDDKDGKNG